MNKPPIIFDRFCVRKNIKGKDQENYLYEGIESGIRNQLIDHIKDIKRNFKVALAFGNQTLEIVDALSVKHGIDEVFIGNQSELILKQYMREQSNRVCFDEELIPFKDNSFDIIISNLSLHWINDLPGTLIQLRKTLKKDGVFLATIVGGKTLSQLREALLDAEIEVSNGVKPRVSPFVDVKDAGNLLSRAGFTIPVSESDTYYLEADSIYELFHQLKIRGQTNALVNRTKGLTLPKLFQEADRIYKKKFSTKKNKIIITLEIITLTGWKFSENQQKPLKPGTATRNLKDSLG